MTRVLSSSESKFLAGLNLRGPLFDNLVEDYCGISLSELMKKEESDYETEDFWTETDLEPTNLQKVLVEMLHLAYTRGEEF